MAEAQSTVKARAGGAPSQAALEEERDFLLRSLDDLEAEHAAGDLDRHDYETLRDTYTARAADVLRRLSARGGGGDSDGGDDLGPAGDDATADGASATDPSPEPAVANGTSQAVTAGSAAPPRLYRRLGLVAGLLAFAVLAGVILARSAGERGVNDSLTGAIDPSARTKVLECQAQGSTGGDLLGALQCFDKILLTDPANAEALTYRGWYLILAAGSLQQSSADAEQAAQADELTQNGLDFLNRAIAADPELPDPLAFRAVVYDRQGRSDLVCADITRLLALNPPEFFVTQTSGLAQRNNCPGVSSTTTPSSAPPSTAPAGPSTAPTTSAG